MFIESLLIIIFMNSNHFKSLFREMKDIYRVILTLLKLFWFNPDFFLDFSPLFNVNSYHYIKPTFWGI